MPKVLYILSSVRSGSTVLDLALGSLEGYFSTGEFRRIWENTRPGGRLCACRRPLPECPFWAPVLDQLSLCRELGSEFLEQVNRRTFQFRPSRADRLVFGQTMAELYQVTARQSQAKVVVDSSKKAFHPGLLGQIEGVEPYAIHLVRDPRAVEFSKTKRRKSPRSLRWHLNPHNPLALLVRSLDWGFKNAACEWVLRRHLPGRWLRVRYEDFVRNPESVLQQIAQLVAEPVPVELGPDHTLRLGQHHMVSGSLGPRTTQGSLSIRGDHSWKERLPAWRRALVSALLWPLLLRYGYVI